MSIGLTLKTLAIVALVAASTVVIVLNEQAGTAHLFATRSVLTAGV